MADTEGVNDNLTEYTIAGSDTAAGSAVADIRCGISGGNAAAVAASTHLRPPTVVVTFNIERVTADLTERVDAEARLRELVTKIEDERMRRLDEIKTLQDGLEAAAESDQQGS